MKQVWSLLHEHREHMVTPHIKFLFIYDILYNIYIQWQLRIVVVIYATSAVWGILYASLYMFQIRAYSIRNFIYGVSYGGIYAQNIKILVWKYLTLFFLPLLLLLLTMRWLFCFVNFSWLLEFFTEVCQ